MTSDDVVGVRDALLVAVGRYENSYLRELRSPSRDAGELAAVLEDKNIGSFDVTKVVDQPSYLIAQSIERFFRNRSRDDLLLLHLSCHGIKSDDGLLYFAATNTDKDLLGSTAVAAEFVSAMMKRCRARSIVILLDCCYSGAFLSGMKGGGDIHVEDELGGFGRAVLTASNRTEYSWEGDGSLVTMNPGPSRFTAAIVEGLRTGRADHDGDGRIAVDELYHHVYEQLRRSKARQTPQMWAELERRIYLAYVGPNQKGNAAGPKLAEQSWMAGAGEPTPAAPDLVSYAPRSGLDIHVPVELELSEVVFGNERPLTFDVFTKCVACSGAGADPEVANNICLSCSGEGRVLIRRTITVKIPPGVEDGMMIRLRGVGDVGRHGRAVGDIYVEILEHRDPRFRRSGDDFYHRLSIPKSLAESGGVAEVDTLDGRVKIRIPAGIAHGSTLRLRGRGNSVLYGGARGDLMLEILLSGE